MRAISGVSSIYTSRLRNYLGKNHFKIILKEIFGKGVPGGGTTKPGVIFKRIIALAMSDNIDSTKKLHQHVRTQKNTGDISPGEKKSSHGGPAQSLLHKR